MEILIQVFIGVVVGVLSVVIIDFRNKWEKAQAESKEEYKAMKKILIELSGYIIDEFFDVYMSKGFIPREKLTRIVRLYELYHILGGNGTRTTEIEKLKELPNVLAKTD